MSYVNLGATAPPTEAQQAVASLQAQINRFLPTSPIPVNGTLDLTTANAAVMLLIQRFTGAFINDPKNAATRQLYLDASKHTADALPWVTANLGQVTATIRDFANFSGKPPARGGDAGGGDDLTTVLVIGGVAVGLMLLSRKKRRR